MTAHDVSIFQVAGGRSFSLRVIALALHCPLLRFQGPYEGAMYPRLARTESPVPYGRQCSFKGRLWDGNRRKYAQFEVYCP